MKSVIGKKKRIFKKILFCICSQQIQNKITLASKINDNSCNPLDYIQSNVQSMAIPNYNEYDVTVVINSPNNSIPRWDNIPALIAKPVIHCFIKPLVF